MTDEQHEVVDRFVQSVAADLTTQGFPRIPALVLLALTVSETGRLTSAELSAQLGVSAAAISGAVRYLTLLNFVRTLTEPGSKRHIYALTDTPWYTATLRSAGRFRETTDRLRATADALGDSRPDASARMHELADFYAFMQEALPRMLVEWNELARGSACGFPREGKRDERGEAQRLWLLRKQLGQSGG